MLRTADRVEPEEIVSTVERRFDVLRRLTGLEKMGSAFVERCLDAWSSLRAGAHPAVRAAIEAHLGRSPLVRDLR